LLWVCQLTWFVGSTSETVKNFKNRNQLLILWKLTEIRVFNTQPKFNHFPIDFESKSISLVESFEFEDCNERRKSSVRMAVFCAQKTSQRATFWFQFFVGWKIKFRFHDTADILNTMKYMHIYIYLIHALYLIHTLYWLIRIIYSLMS